MHSYSDTSDRLIVCAALLGRIYRGGYDGSDSKLIHTVEHLQVPDK